MNVARAQALMTSPPPVRAATLFAVVAQPLKLSQYPNDTVLNFTPGAAGPSAERAQLRNRADPSAWTVRWTRRCSRLAAECGVTIHLNSAPGRSPSKANAHRNFSHRAALSAWKVSR